MTSNIFLKSAVLLTILTIGANANSDGFYVGANASFITLGDDSMTVKNQDKTKTTYHNINSFNFKLKAGYQHYNGNRIELYAKRDEVNTKEGDISAKTFGINYEWAFNSLASEKLLPYASLGVGLGKASSSKLKVLDDMDVGETTCGLGVRYKISENINTQIGYEHTIIGFDGKSDKKLENDPDVSQNNIMVSVAYKF